MSRKRLVDMKTNQSEPLGLIPAPLLLSGSVRCQPLIPIPPAQLALAFVPALYLCLRFVPAFKGNNYSCAPPEQTLIKICVRSNNVCMDPHRAQLNVFVKVWSASSYLLTQVTTNGHDNDRNWGNSRKVVLTVEGVDSSRAIISSCSGCKYLKQFRIHYVSQHDRFDFVQLGELSCNLGCETTVDRCAASLPL